MASRGFAITYDNRDVVGLLGNLRGVQADLRRNANQRLRAAAAACAAELVSELRANARGTPQAAIVAASAKVKSDRVPAVSVGGNMRVGSRGTQAGAIVWGSERGGTNFAAPHTGSGYWIEPTTKRFQEGKAVSVYLQAVVDVLADHGVL